MSTEDELIMKGLTERLQKLTKRCELLLEHNRALAALNQDLNTENERLRTILLQHDEETSREHVLYALGCV